jgi:hypothetical protein
MAVATLEGLFNRRSPGLRRVCRCVGGGGDQGDVGEKISGFRQIRTAPRLVFNWERPLRDLRPKRQGEN